MKMASPQQRFQSSPSSPSWGAANSRAKPSSSSFSPPPCSQILADQDLSTRPRRLSSHSSSSSSAASSSSSPTPSLSTSPSFAGAKWQAEPPSPRAVPKPPTRWLGAAAGAPPEVGQQQQQQMLQQHARQLRQPMPQRPAAAAGGVAVAAFPIQMRSGCDASEMKALMHPPPPPPSSSSFGSAPFEAAADFKMRTDLSNQLKALLNVA